MSFLTFLFIAPVIQKDRSIYTTWSLTAVSHDNVLDLCLRHDYYANDDRDESNYHASGDNVDVMDRSNKTPKTEKTQLLRLV